MAHKKKAAWYSVTLNLGRITEVIPASPEVIEYRPDSPEASVRFTPVPDTPFGWNQ